MKTTVISKRCRILATVSLLTLLACNSDELLQDSATDSQGGQTGSATDGASVTDNVPTGGGANASNSLSDSEVGGNSDSHSGTEGASGSASVTVSASETATESASNSNSMTDTDGVSASNSNSNSNSDSMTDGTASASAGDSMTDTDGTASASASDSTTGTDGAASASAGDTDTDTVGTASDTQGTMSGANSTGDICDPNLPNNNACEGCMIDNCCEAYEACVADKGCLCLVNKCSTANNTVTCALLQCNVNALALPVTLGYLLQCTGECGLLCPVLGIL